MKKFCLMLVAGIAMSLTSCQFKEEITIKEDGSGKMSFKFDGSEFMGKMAAMGGDKKDPEVKKEKIDSIVDFNDFLEEKRDSISKLPAEEQARLANLKDLKMHMIVDEEKGDFTMDIFTNFKDVNTVGDLFSAMNTANSMKDEKMAAGPKMGENSTTKYNYNGKSFSRDVTVTDKEAYTASLGEMEKYNMFLEGAKYQLVYHFPKKVKKINFEGALFSQDGKTVTLEVDFGEYLKNPELLDIEVTF